MSVPASAVGVAAIVFVIVSDTPKGLQSLVAVSVSSTVPRDISLVPGV